MFYDLGCSSRTLSHALGIQISEVFYFITVVELSEFSIKLPQKPFKLNNFFIVPQFSRMIYEFFRVVLL